MVWGPENPQDARLCWLTAGCCGTSVDADAEAAEVGLAFQGRGSVRVGGHSSQT